MDMPSHPARHERIEPPWHMRPAAIALVLLALAAAIATAVLLRPAVTERHSPRPSAETRGPASPRPPLPAPPAADLLPLGRDAARVVNAAVPFSTAPVPAAAPLRLAARGYDRERAIDCLAAAAYYEAGEDATGKAAVAQVVLNRLRHPAFPKTVCGVVFEGADRTTGCQFTFTCDGALARYRPGAAAWQRARTAAAAAIDGEVFRKVGYATHYHTDWVVPYWSSSLDKVATVGTHLFFRWRGYWGTPPAFAGRVDAAEPAVPQLAHLSPNHVGEPVPLLEAGDVAALDDIEASTPANAAGVPGITAVPGQPSVFLVTLAPALADRYPAIALGACGEMRNCRFLAWSGDAIAPRTLPLGREQLAAVAFSYVRDRNSGFERLTWNCTLFPGRMPCTPASAAASKTTPSRATKQ